MLYLATKSFLHYYSMLLFDPNLLYANILLRIETFPKSKISREKPNITNDDQEQTLRVLLMINNFGK